MMQYEFEELLGHSVSPEAYRVIERCYINFDFLFPTKESVASYYKKHDLNFFESLSKEIDVISKREENLNQKIFSLTADTNKIISSLQEEINKKDSIINSIKTITSLT